MFRKRTSFGIMLLLAVVLIGGGAGRVEAATINKANNTDNLNLGTSWVGDVVPGASDIAMWEAILGGANTVSLGDSSQSFGGINIYNPGGTVTINAGNTLTLGSSGVDMTGASQDLTLSCGLTLGSAQTWNVQTGRTLTVDGAVANGANLLTVQGAGTITMSGVIGNGAGGLTKSDSGTLTLNGSAVNTYTGATTVNGGTLVVDFANLGTPTSLINATSTLTLGGGILSIKGKSSGITAQTLGNVTLNAGGGQILGNVNGGTSTTITLGSLTTTAAGGSLLVGYATGTSGLTITTTSDHNAQTNYGGRVVWFSGTADTGYDWATTASASSPFTLSAFTAYYTMVVGATSNTLDARITAALTLTGAHTHNSLKMQAPTTARALAIGAYSITLTSGGLLATGTKLWTISGTTGATRLRPSAGGDLVIHQYTSVAGGLTISAVIGDNTSASSLIKTGSGTLTLSGANTYTGTTRVNAGMLAYGANNVISNGAVTVNGSTAILSLLTYSDTVGTVTVDGGGSITSSSGILTTTGTFEMKSGSVSAILAGAVALNKTTGGTMRMSGANTRTGVTTINEGILSVGTIGNGGVAGNLGAAAAAVGNIVLGGGTLQYTGATASTTRGFTLTAGTTSTIGITTGTNTLTISGGSANTTGNLTKTDAGTLVLSGANLYTGTTRVNAGTLAYGIANAISNGPVTVNGSTAILNLVTYADTVGTVTVDGGGSITNTSSAGILTTTGTFEMKSGTVSAILAGAVPLNKTTSGTMRMSGANTYGGDTTISAGTLRIGSANVIPDGASKGNVSVTGTLDLNQFSETINGLSGAGTVDTVTGGSPTLTVGANDQTSEFSGTIKNTAGTLALTKTGTNTLTLSGANTYDGSTIVSNGTLLVNGSLGGAGSVTAINSGTLGGTGAVAGAVFIYAGGTLAPGSNSIGILTLTNGVTFTGGTFRVNVAGTNSGGYGQVKVTGGDVIITNATLAVNGFGGYSPGDNDYLWIINKTNAGAVSGVFAGLPEDGETNISGSVFTMYYNADFDTGGTSGGNDVLLAAKRTFYFVGAGGNWSAAANWATNSGGTGGFGVPNINSPVFFDANSTGSCTLAANAAAKSINTTGYTNTLALDTYDLSVAQNLVHTGGTITIGASASAGLDVAASITNSAIMVCSGTSKINCGGNWNGSSGTFTASTSIVTLDGANAQVITTGGAWNAPTTNNNWKNNWYELNVLNTNGVTFADGFKAGKFTCTNAGAELYFKWQEAVTNVFNITNSSGLNIQGTASKQILLERFGGSGSNQWEICPSTPDHVWTVSNVIVSNSVNSASTNININPMGDSTDGGNNDNWFTYTLVTLGWFDAIGRDNSVTVRWKTESEVNNAGFNIYRSLSQAGTYTRVNAGFIWGLGTSTRGSEYAFIDNAVTNGGTYYYKLESVEFDGKSTFYGPAVAYPGLDTDGDGMTDDWELFYGLNVSSNDANADPDSDGFTNYQEFEADTNPQNDGSEEWGGASRLLPDSGDSDIFKIAVTEDGVYRLTHGYLEAAGITNLSEWAMDNIRMYNQGSEIQLYVHNEGAPGFGTNDYVEFYGTGSDSRFTDANVYWLYLATNAGSRMAEISGTGGNLKTNYWHTEHFEENKFYWDELPDESPDDDHWFFTNVLSAYAAPSSTNMLNPVLTNISGINTTAQIRVAFRGINYNTPHHVQVNINGYNLPDGYWSGDTQYAYSATTAQSNLVEGTNTVLVTLPGDTGAAVERVLINWVEIDYARNLQAVSNSLIFTLSRTETNEYTIAGYTTNDLQVFKVVNSTNVSVITNLSVQGTGPYTAGFSDIAVSGITYAVVGPDGRKTPASIVEDASSNLRSTTNGADYIIITYNDFYDAVQPLASHRRSEGMRVKVVRIQDIYDDFNFGIFSPYAIRDFLSYARLYWNQPSPTYVALIGDATYDYKDNEAKGTVNYVPVKMVHDAESLETPSDNWYVALDGGGDFMADMYIGRLPARTTNEVTTLVNKIIDYEEADAEANWARNVMLVADDEPQFEEMNESVAAYLYAGYQTNRIYLSEYLDEEDCTADIIAGFNNGALITHYAGHGSTTLWAHEYIFGTWDIPSLTNGVRLPFVITPTCYNGYFISPSWRNNESLAEGLVRKANGGAIACFSPAGMSTPPQQEILVNGLFEAVFDEGCFQLGPAITRAKLKTYQQLGGGSRSIIETFILFGDPALRLKKWSGYTGDTNPPAITQTSPTNGSITVGITDDIRILFSEAMDDVMTRAAFSISPQVAGSFSWDGTTLIFDPQGPFNYFTTYTVQIASNACDLAGNLLTNDYSFTFTPFASVSGAITYTRYQTGSIRVLVSSSAASVGSDTAGVANVTIAAPGPYTCFPAPGGIYWVWAFRDSNGNGSWDRGEAIGEYASNSIGITSNLVGIDVTLVDQDADSDGLTDYVEINIYHTNPDKADTDSDGLTDWQELRVYSTDPNKANSDEDGLSDGEEIAIGTDPNNPDTDGDGLTDGQEVVIYLTNPNDPDSDSDGLSDGWEVAYGTNPLEPDSDHDELTDFDEVFVYGSNPNDADSDHDGATDLEEVIAGTSPNDDTDMFKISEMSQQVADTFVLECETIPGRFYRLQTTTNLVSAWTNIGEEIEGIGDIIGFTNNPSEQSRFYRIRVRQ